MVQNQLQFLVVLIEGKEFDLLQHILQNLEDIESKYGTQNIFYFIVTYIEMHEVNEFTRGIQSNN